MTGVPDWLVQATAEAAPELVSEQVDRLRLVLAAPRPSAALDDGANADRQSEADEVRAA